MRALLTFLKDIDQRQLTFKGLNQPARRFLYFRFIITYLHAKASGNVSFTNSVEIRKIFWASGGEYLHRSTLRSLARNISGLELPEPLSMNSFDDTSVSELEADSVGTALAADLRQAATASMKNGDDEDDDMADEDEEMQDEEDV